MVRMSFEMEPAAAAAAGRRRSHTSVMRRMSNVALAHVPSHGGKARELAGGEAPGGADGAGPELQGGLQPNEAVANFVITCVGAGIVVYPSIMKENGAAVAFVLLPVVAAVLYECGMVIVDCCVLAEASIGLGPGSVATYEGVAEAAFGRPGLMVLSVTKNVYMLGAVLAYTVMTVDGLRRFLGFLSPAVVRWLIVAPIFLTISLVRDLKQITPLAPVGAVAVFAQCLAIIVGSVVSYFVSESITYTENVIEIGKLGSLISVYAFGCDGIITLPGMRPQMADVKELPGALSKGFGIVIGVCAVVMCSGYLGYGEKTGDNIITGSLLGVGDHWFPQSAGWLSAAMIVVNLLISCPIIFYSFTSFIESQGTDPIHTPWSPVNLAARLCLMLSLLILGSALPFAKELIGLISAVFGTCNSIFFPIAYYYTLRTKVDASNLPDVRPLTGALKAFHAAAIATGLVAIVFGTQSGFQGLQAKLAQLAEESA